MEPGRGEVWKPLTPISPLSPQVLAYSATTARQEEVSQQTVAHSNSGTASKRRSVQQDLIDENILETVTRAQRVWITPTLPTICFLASHVQFVNQVKQIQVPAP
uniref:Uncharacterized protein n=1 Tax=Macaca fascicularis TaxID=9541 RepID=A0A7N9D6G0_MACFA